MSTAIDICNLALSRLGDEATVSSIDPPEGSAQATHCARFYPIALSRVLDYSYWTFATTRGTLNQLSAPPKSGWQYAYAPPSNSMNIVALFLPGSTNDTNPQEFEVEVLEDGTPVVYANVLNPICMYTLRAVDPSRFQPMFEEALVTLLMSYLAGPVLKGNEGAKMSMNCYQMYTVLVARAAASDAQQRKVEVVHKPDFLAIRDPAPAGTYPGGMGGWPR